MNRSPLLFAGALLAPMQVFAADLAVNVEIPRINVAEYHRPYVAAWIETPEGQVATNLSVWYDTKMKDGGGTKWLKDMRQWWRRAGRSVQMPVDGVSGATKPAGTHAIKANAKQLAALKPGNYVLQVEAARENGGREMVALPFAWGKAGSASAKGKTELGAVKLVVKP